MQCLRSGFLPFEESTVHVRVKSTINGITSDPIFSTAIDRAATTFQSSECGSFCTVGIIGDATQGGWDKDTDMRLADATKVDKETWTITVYLVGGKKVKFRASDSWDTNWGATAFPDGTGTAGGPDIPVPTTGYYKVTFNSESGAYTFTALSYPDVCNDWYYWKWHRQVVGIPIQILHKTPRMLTCGPGQ